MTRTSPSGLGAAVFLDRDGVLNPDVGFPHRLEHAVLFDDVVPALARLARHGFKLLVISNQGGVARGLFDLEAVARFNAALSARLAAGGIALGRGDFHICPHGPEDGCRCRKPHPGLLYEAAGRHRVDLSRSVTIGDRESDVEAGRRAGTRTLRLVRDGDAVTSAADGVVASLHEAAEWILRLASDEAGAPREGRGP